MRAVRVGGDNGELRPRYYIYVYITESGLMMRVRCGQSSGQFRRSDGRCVDVLETVLLPKFGV